MRKRVKGKQEGETMKERMNNCKGDRRTQGKGEKVEGNKEREWTTLRKGHRDSGREGGERSFYGSPMILPTRSIQHLSSLKERLEISQWILVFIYFSCYDSLIILNELKEDFFTV